MGISLNKTFLYWLLQFLLWALPLLAMVSFSYHTEVKSFQNQISSEEVLSVHVGKEVIIKNLEAIST
ncbi:MAG: hypothetical protein DRQ47_04985, partial [Gammaproteobacteria bacterium]